MRIAHASIFLILIPLAACDESSQKSDASTDLLRGETLQQDAGKTDQFLDGIGTDLSPLDTAIPDASLADSAYLDTWPSDASLADAAVDTNAALVDANRHEAMPLDAPPDLALDAVSPPCSLGFISLARTWQLPASGAAHATPYENFPSGGKNCATGSGSFVYRFVDLNGDQKRDLVVSLACDDAQVGKTKWRVYLGTATGLATVATSWLLPPSKSSSPQPFFSADESTSPCSTWTMAPRYRVFDIDGDLKPDMVISDRCDTEVGTTRWLVYRNTGSGFAQSPTRWALPAYSVPTITLPFEDTRQASTSICFSNNERPAYRIFDLDGDRRPDFVVSSDCTDASVGVTKWVYHRNTGTRFASAATNWRLPPYGGSKVITPTFLNTSLNTADCSKTPPRPRYRIFDIDGDKKTDFVVSDDCSDTALGKSKWHVFKGGVGGFAQTPLSWPLPAFSHPAKMHPFTNMRFGTSWCSSSVAIPRYRIFDANGDKRPDFVVSEHCDPAVGVSRWDVYTNSGSGFSPKATCFSLPPYGSGLSLPFKDSEATQNPACLGSKSRPRYRIMDINGDHRVDFIASDDCIDQSVGLSKLLVHLGR